MSDEGERNCPLCAEEMDLTDRQLKPCKCGYEICIWCWHHIMNMAEKDETEGRCPACRTPYNKEKIVGMAANCGRLVAEMNIERKMKSQKAKSKTSEGRKQLSSVRVIQRNLVYIVGLPLNLADEELLQHREYFGQYGKVLKVSISRTAAGTIQHFANNTCSVYITYSKEEEAVRCIQSVHGFVLDGRSLRACFGTTKYCHAWLRNVPCSNPDCLYLHEVGSQEDSFTKDEIISAYTRSRVQQITGATNNMQRRSGNVLPPAADEYYINSSISSGKPISKSASNNLASSIRGSPPNSSSGQSVLLPAAASWGTRTSNIQPPSASLACSNGPSNQKPETCSGSLPFSTAVSGTTQASLLHGDIGKKLISNEEGQTNIHKGEQEPLEPGRQYEGTDRRQYEGTDRQTTASEAPAPPGLPATSTVNGQLHSPPLLEDKDRFISVAPNITNAFDLSGQSYGSDKDLNVTANENFQNFCSDMASLNIDGRLGDEHSRDARHNSSLSDNILVNSPRDQGSQFREPLMSIALGKSVASTDDSFVTREQSDLRSDFLPRDQSGWKSDSQTQVANKDSQVAIPEVEEDLRYFENQRLKDPEIVTRTSYFSNPSNSFHLSSHSRVYSSQQNEPYGSSNFNQNSQILDNKVDKVAALHQFGVSRVPNRYREDRINSSVDSDRTGEYSYLLPSEVKRMHVGRYEGEAINDNQNVATNVGESSIISNMLSVDFDAWDESLTSPQNLAKLLGETDRRQGSHKLSSSWKGQNSSQSRFSFARQESTNQLSGVEPSLSNIGQMLEDCPSRLDFAENRDFNFDRLGDCNGFSTFNIEESDNFAGSYSHLSSNTLSVARAQVPPPGFSMPNRAPPPGFASHERMEPSFDAMSWNPLLDASSHRNQYQALPAGNIGNPADIEFMDPAILAVGKGRLPVGLNNAASLDMRSNFSSQLSAFENEARLQLMQRSLSPLQNQRYADMGVGFAQLNDAYRIPSRIMEQSLPNNLSPFSQLALQQPRTELMSNGRWDAWNEIQSRNDMGMAELLRNERLGYNKVYNGYEDLKFQMPGSGDLYNRTYGI